MTTLKIILAATGAAICFGYALWLKLQPKNAEGCWLRLPGHIRDEDRKWQRDRRRREQRK